MKVRVSYILNAVLVLACVATWTWFVRAQRTMEATRLAGTDVPLLAARWKTAGPVELYLKDTHGTEQPFQSPYVGKNIKFTDEIAAILTEQMVIMQQLLMAPETPTGPLGKEIGTLRGTLAATGAIERLPVRLEDDRRISVQLAGKTYSTPLSEKSLRCLHETMKQISDHVAPP